MPSTRRQKTKVMRSIKMDSFLDFENLDVTLGDENSNSIEQKLANTNNGSVSQNDAEVASNYRLSSSQENASRDFNVENEIA